MENFTINNTIIKYYSGSSQTLKMFVDNRIGRFSLKWMLRGILKKEIDFIKLIKLTFLSWLESKLKMIFIIMLLFWILTYN